MSIVTHLLSQFSGGGGQDNQEFEGSLGYLISSKPIQAMQQDFLKKNQGSIQNTQARTHVCTHTRPPRKIKGVASGSLSSILWDLDSIQEINSGSVKEDTSSFGRVLTWSRGPLFYSQENNNTK